MPDNPGKFHGFKVLVKTVQYRTANELPQGIRFQPAIEGLLINRITELSFDEQRLLRGSIRADLGTILILEEAAHRCRRQEACCSSAPARC